MPILARSHAWHKPQVSELAQGRLFESVWQDGGRIVFVKPRPAFVPYFRDLAESALDMH
jgi:hypothetical protein